VACSCIVPAATLSRQTSDAASPRMVGARHLVLELCNLWPRSTFPLLYGSGRPSTARHLHRAHPPTAPVDGHEVLCGITPYYPHTSATRQRIWRRHLVNRVWRDLGTTSTSGPERPPTSTIRSVARRPRLTTTWVLLGSARQPLREDIEALRVYSAAAHIVAVGRWGYRRLVGNVVCVAGQRVGTTDVRYVY